MQKARQTSLIELSFGSSIEFHLDFISWSVLLEKIQNFKSKPVKTWSSLNLEKIRVELGKGMVEVITHFIHEFVCLFCFYYRREST